VGSGLLLFDRKTVHGLAFIAEYTPRITKNNVKRVLRPGGGILKAVS
jgi:hypothetical protein